MWMSYRRKVFSLQSPYPRILVAKHAKNFPGVCEEVWSMSKVCPKYSPTRGVLNPLSSPWPFAQWGLDIVGPFPWATGNRRWHLIGTDYFTKWVEVEPLSNIRDVDARRFIWRNIAKFGVPHKLILDNGIQFDSKAFRRYCGELGIRNRYSTPAYL